MRIRSAIAFLASVLTAAAGMAQDNPGWTPPDPATKALARGIFEQLVNINTTDSVGSVTAASKAMQQRFLDAGFPASDLYLGGPNDRKETRSSVITEPVPSRPSSLSAISMSSKPTAPTGPLPPSTSLKRMATSTVGALRT